MTPNSVRFQSLGLSLALFHFVLCSDNIALAQAKNIDPLPTIETILENLNKTDVPPKVQDFLKAIPNSWKQNFTFMYESESIQDASREYPRAFTFSDSGDVVLAFNGNRDQAGFNRVEMALVRPETNEIEFRDLTFCEDTNASGPCKGKLSEANPELCQTCHGENSHYIWKPYNNWPGAYGSRDDILRRAQNKEDEAYLAFKRAATSHPRYRELVWKTDHGPAYPYLLDRSPDLSLDQRVNARFTMAIMHRHANFLATKIINATDGNPDLLEQFIKTLAGCNAERRSIETQLTELAEKANLPVEKYWSFSIEGNPYQPLTMLTYSDGLMGIAGLTFSALVARLNDYNYMLKDHGAPYAAIDKKYSLNTRTIEFFAALDALIRPIPSAGQPRNALDSYIDHERAINFEKLCSQKL